MTTCNAHPCTVPALPVIEVRPNALRQVADLSRNAVHNTTAIFHTPALDREEHRVRREAHAAREAREHAWRRTLWLGGPRP